MRPLVAVVAVVAVVASLAVAPGCLLFAEGPPCRADRHCDPGERCVVTDGVCEPASSDGGAPADGGVDGGRDGGLDAGFDAGLDAGFDAGPDAGADAGRDGGFDAGWDGGSDTRLDGGVDAGFDGGFDAGVDAGPVAVCGDGVPEGSEDCDDGSDPFTGNSNTRAGACRLDCTLARCGDGVVDPGNSEQCDDRNQEDSDGCSSTCTEEPSFTCLQPLGAASVCVADALLLSTAGCVDDPVCLASTIASAASGSVIRVVEDTYDEAVVIDGKDLTLVAEGLTTHTYTGVDGAPTLRVDGGATVEVYGVTIKRGGGSSIPAVTVAGAGTELTLHSVVVSDSPATGVRATTDASLVVFDSFVQNNDGYGIDALSSTSLRVERSRIFLNRGGGVYASGINTEVRNSLFVANGDVAGTVGGMRVTAGLTAFAHNTVLNNVNDGVYASGLSCLLAESPVFASIVSGNTLGDDCTATYSIVQGGGGGTNLDVDPQLDSNWAPIAGSPAVDQVPTSPLVDDYRRLARPRGAAWDVGAIERP